MQAISAARYRKTSEEKEKGKEEGGNERVSFSFFDATTTRPRLHRKE